MIISGNKCYKSDTYVENPENPRTVCFMSSLFSIFWLGMYNVLTSDQLFSGSQLV